MKHKTNTFLASLALAACSLANAQSNSLPTEAAKTLADVSTSVKAVKEPSVREPLAAWVAACGAQKWGSCQAAWWKMLHGGGLTRVEDDDGFVYFEYPNNDDANKALSDMLGLFEMSSAAKSAWQMEVSTRVQTRGMPIITQGQRILVDNSELIAVMRIVEQRFKERGLKANIRERMDNDQAEWLRLVSLMYAVRDDKNATYDALAQLQQSVLHSGSDPEDVAIYNFTVKAVQTYLNKKEGA